MKCERLLKENIVRVINLLPYGIKKHIWVLLQKQLILVDGPIKYAKNGLYTKHNADFYNDGLFRKAYEESCRITGFLSHPAPWRIYICCWAIKRAVQELEGDLVECGVWKGTTSYAGLIYSSWGDARKDKTFWLVDSWEGLDSELLIEGENINTVENKRNEYSGLFPSVKKTFSKMEGINLIKGFVPKVLEEVNCKQVSYLHIDMNCAQPEVEAVKYFWDKLVPGAIVILDDYGFASHEIQKKVIDQFCIDNNSEVLSLPTGQGMIVKGK